MNIMHIVNNALSLANYVTATIGSAAASIALVGFVREHSELSRQARSVIVGAIILLCALSAHQLYWGLGRFGTVIEYKELVSSIYAHASLATVAYAAVVYGSLTIWSAVINEDGRIRWRDIIIVAGVWLTIVAATATGMVMFGTDDMAGPMR